MSNSLIVETVVVWTTVTAGRVTGSVTVTSSSLVAVVENVLTETIV